jgi:hypothetical protein
MNRMQKIAKEIIFINYGQSYDQIRSDYFDILRKYKIKQGVKLPNGHIQIANFDWTMCESLFNNMFKVYLDMNESHVGAIPKDLEY